MDFFSIFLTLIIIIVSIIFIFSSVNNKEIKEQDKTTGNTVINDNNKSINQSKQKEQKYLNDIISISSKIVFVIWLFIFVYISIDFDLFQKERFVQNIFILISASIISFVFAFITSLILKAIFTSIEETEGNDKQTSLYEVVTLPQKDKMNFENEKTTFTQGKYRILDSCIGCGVCEAICGEVFSVEDIAKINEANIDLNIDKVELAIDACPISAIEKCHNNSYESAKNINDLPYNTQRNTVKNSSTITKSTSTNKKQVNVILQHPEVKENNVKADEYIENANNYETKKDYINAINEYTKAIELNPDNIADIYLYRAQCCLELCQYKNVVEDCSNAIEKTKMYNSTAYYTRGLAYEKLNLLDKAKEDYKQALSIKPDDKIYQEAYNKLLQTNSIIDLANCTKEEIQSLNGFNEEKAQRFIEEKNNGKMWYDIDSFVQDFELQPHEMVLIQDRIKFPDKPKSRYGRKIDI